MTSERSSLSAAQSLDKMGFVNRWLPVPLHLQVRDLLVGLIERGELQPDEPLPPEQDIAARYGVSLAPVRQALLGLVQEGIVYRVRGRGTFVRHPSVVEEVSHLVSFTETMRAKGCTVDVKVLHFDLVATPTEVATGLRIRDRQVLLLERLAVVNGESFAVLTAYLPRKRFSALQDAAEKGGSLYRTLQRRFGIVPSRAETLIGLVPCSTTLSPVLELPVGTPLLSARGVTFDRDDVPFEFFQVLYRSDRVQLRVDSHRLEESRVGSNGTSAKRYQNSRSSAKQRKEML
jgi:GntR family transcriptional regulator